MERIKIRLTGTSISKGYVDAGMEFRSLLKKMKGIDTEQMKIPDNKNFKVIMGGGEFSLNIYRPRTKNGAFRRISIKKEFVNKCSLVPGTELVFSDVDGDMHMEVVLPDREGPGQAIKAQGYPDALSNWFSSNRGGVRFIFDQSSGKPLLDVRTPLSTRLAKLAMGMVEEQERPRMIMLAGGAGNGKTHAIEKFMLSLVEGREQAFQEEFIKRAKESHTVIFDPSTSDAHFFKPSIRAYDQLAVIQDASEASEGDMQAADYLAKQLASIFRESSSNKLLLVCVNRGVLYSAASRLRTQEILQQQVSAITRALDPLNVDTDCWPLREYPDCFVWPLDLDSLAVRSSEPSIVEQVLDRLQQQDWSAVDVLVDGHPAKHALQCLRTPSFHTSLAKAFHEYEVASNKNLSFRRINSVLGYLFTGGWTPQEGKRTPLGRIEDLEVNDGPFGVDSWQGRLECYSNSLPSLLFPAMPEVQAIRSFLAKGKHHDPGIANLLKILCDGIDWLKARQARRHAAPGAELFLKPENEWSSLMDPARCVRVGPGLEDLDIKLALDLGSTISVLRDKVDTASWAVLEWLNHCSECLGRAAESEQRMLDNLHWPLRWITRLAAVILKRALALHYMVAGQAMLHSTERVERYLAIMTKPQAEQETYQERVCAFMLGDPSTGDGTEDHVIELAKGLCQPFARSTSSVRLVFQQRRDAELLQTSGRRPHANLHVVQFSEGTDKVRVPITLSMHDFMHDVKDLAQLTGSMPAAIRGAVDSFRLQLDGRTLRSGNKARFLFGSRGQVHNLSIGNLANKVGLRNP